MNSWIIYFFQSLKELEHDSNMQGSAAWTIFLTKIMQRIGKKMDCYVQSKNIMKDGNSGEYLNIDALFFKNDDCKDWVSNYPPPVLPAAAIEMENDYAKEKIAYCLWKIICIRSEIRVVICHQDNKQKCFLLRQYLEEVLSTKKFVKEKDSLYVIIGNDACKEGSPWEEYYSVFQWQDGSLENIKLG